MKKMKNRITLLSWAVIMLFMVTSCNQNKRFAVSSQPLMTETQFYNYENSQMSLETSLAVDVPVDGPQPVVDSVIKFLNKELYTVFEEQSASPMHNPNSVYTDDVSQILQNYTEHYQNDGEQALNSSFSLNIFMIAQTESFVTYRTEYLSDSSALNIIACHTFDKRDGHEVREIISPKELESIGGGSSEFYGAGLTCKGVLVNDRRTGSYRIIPYKEIITHLSRESQKLVNRMGENTLPWSNCLVGERLGKVNSIHGETFILTQRPRRCDWTLDGPELEETWPGKWESGIPQLMAFNADKSYKPANILAGKCIIESNWDEMFTSNPDCNAFAFDSSTECVYIPCAENVMMGEHDCFDKYIIMRFNRLNEFILQEEAGGFWLHPILRDMERLILAGSSETYLIRVDEMRLHETAYGREEEDKEDSCRFRLAVWRGNEEMSDKPEALIYNGYIGKDGYLFHDDKFTYIISSDGELLSIYKDGKLHRKENLTSVICHIG